MHYCLGPSGLIVNQMGTLKILTRVNLGCCLCVMDTRHACCTCWFLFCAIFLVCSLHLGPMETVLESFPVVFLLLTPKVLEAISQAFLKFGQAIVDAMFVQKISNFW
jgi:hypothetical protein